MEQPHQAADIPRSGDIAPFARFAGAREQAADQLVRHVERGVGKPGFEIDDRSDEHRPPPVRGIAGDLVRVGDAALADELPKAVFMDPAGGFGRDADVADRRSRSSSDRTWSGFGGGRSIPQPRERRCVERRVGNEQRIELGELRRGKAREQRICGSLACPGTPGDGGALDNRRCRQE